MVKCKTEVIALKTFLDWLEQRKEADSTSDGIVLVYNESIKFVPYMLLEALKKYDLVDRFSKLVKGFVDGHALAVNKANTVEKLEALTKEEDLEKNFEGNAMVRARAAYELLEQLAKSKSLRLCCSVIYFVSCKSFAFFCFFLIFEYFFLC